MIWIEMMGPSGVGKSYWYRYIKQEYSHITPEAVLSSRAPVDALRLGRRGRIKQKLDSYGILPSRYLRGLEKQIARSTIKKFGAVDHEADSELPIDLVGYLDVLWRYNTEMKDPIRRAKMISFVLRRRLPKFVAVAKLARKNDIICFEDGIVHNNGGISEEYTDSDHIPCCPDRILYLTSTPARVLNNRMTRLAEGHGTFVEQGLSETELEKLCYDAHVRVEKKVGLLGQHGASVIRIDVEADDNQVKDAIDTAFQDLIPGVAE